MAGSGTVLVGTLGSGVAVTQDNGETWSEPQPAQGMHSGPIVRSMAQDPLRPEIVYAGTNLGLYRSDNGGLRWQLMDTPMTGSWVWSLTVDPEDTKIIYAGTGTPSAPGVYRTTDGGKSWERLSMEIADHCISIDIPRPLKIALDPTDHRDVWVGIEVDGVRRSTDGGDTWSRVEGVMTNPRENDTDGHNLLDVHDMLMTTGPPKTVVVQVNDDIWTSTNEGATWTAMGFGEIHPLGPGHQPTYMHGMAGKVDDPKVMFVAVGNHLTGSGALMRSKDLGRTWEKLPLPVEPNSPMWTVHASSADPDLVLAATRWGYVYRSDDGGDTWIKLRRDLGAINSLGWVPN